MNHVQPYEAFSLVFDTIMRTQKYDEYERLVRHVWHKHGVHPTSLLDIACGTGNNAVRFSPSMKVVGIDSSEHMLAVARNKGSSATFTKGSFTSFSVHEQFDAAICLDYSTNYLIHSSEFVHFLQRVYTALRPGGIFIFDCKPAAAFKKKEKHIENEEFTYDWQCDISRAPLVTIRILITLHDGRTFLEQHTERGYTVDELQAIVEESPFELVAIYSDGEEKQPTHDTGLLQFVLRK